MPPASSILVTALEENLCALTVNLCSKLQEYNIFILPKNIQSKNDTFNNYKKILTYHLSKLFKRHKGNINVTISIYDPNLNKIINKDIIIDVSEICNTIINTIKNNSIFSLIINNYKFKYGYLIIIK